MKAKKRHLRIIRILRIAAIALVAIALVLIIFMVRERHASAPFSTPELIPEQLADPEEPDPVTEEPQSEQKPEPAPFNTSLHSTTSPASIWVVVNKKHPLSPLNYVPADLVAIGGGQYARTEAATQLTRLIQAGAGVGHQLYPLSGYRSYATQTAVYNNYVRTDGRARADTYSARPGHSEHQTGLAIDVGNGVCNLSACFGTTPAGQWVAAHAHRYGFIIRYPAGKTAVTGYAYEPWHLRYVGAALATEMKRQNIQTLEEFFGITGGTAY